ncbi:hypothetical protein [Plantactinospora sp. GCM10030261]|uniref:hypothetical protein n=1 Tax=Plantactinospora sp. GCM10030261 TaxID=3273420 RepID=UPI00361CAB27
MPEASSDRPSRNAERPDDVTDPMLWSLALGVADAHAPGEDGRCVQLHCGDQSWPCAAWNSAQQALAQARGGASVGGDRRSGVGRPAAAFDTDQTRWRPSAAA